jgi:histidyl-tRNA synthetase
MASDIKKIQAVKGMKDILPEESKLWQAVENKTRQVFARFNYSEIRFPVCERTELFSRGIGEATDIVEKEMFTFSDRNDESITLRPEGTASTVRACIENNLIQENQLLKLYYTGPMFRYEKPQKGRQRQFHQIGAEAIGIDSPYIDAELIIMCKALLEELSITDFTIHINSLGCPDCRIEFKQKLIKFLDANKKDLCQKCLERKDKNPMRFFDCKEKSCTELVVKAPKIIDYICPSCKDHFAKVGEGLKAAEVKFEINPNIVRGLDYYTKTVFEFSSGSLGAQNAILGGGRYNSLIGELGGPNTPASGFAIGVERLILAMKESFKPEFSPLGVYIASLGTKGMSEGFKLACDLRSAKIAAEIDYSGKSLKSQMGRADKSGTNFVIMIGDDEIAKDLYTVRNMKTKEQVQAKREDLVNLIHKLSQENN